MNQRTSGLIMVSRVCVWFGGERAPSPGRVALLLSG